MNNAPRFTLRAAEPREKPGPTWQGWDGRRKPASNRGWTSGQRQCGLRVATPCWPPCAPCATITLSAGSWYTTMCGLSSTIRMSDRAPALGTSSATTSGGSGWRTIQATSPTDRYASSPLSKLCLISQRCYFHLTWSSWTSTCTSSSAVLVALTRGKDHVAN